MRAQECVTPFAAAAAGTSADFELRGGNYLLLVAATGSGGTVTLNAKSANGTYIGPIVGRESAITATGYQHYDGLPPGIYQLVIATLSAITATVERVPTE